MRRRLWLSAAAVAMVAAAVAAVPLLVVVAVRDPALLALGLPLLVVALIYVWRKGALQWEK